MGRDLRDRCSGIPDDRSVAGASQDANREGPSERTDLEPNDGAVARTRDLLCQLDPDPEIVAGQDAEPAGCITFRPEHIDFVVAHGKSVSEVGAHRSLQYLFHKQ